MSNKKGVLYLFPIRISEESTETISIEHQDLLKSCKIFVVEEPKTARRYISSLKLGITIDDLEIHKLTDDFLKDDMVSLLEKCIEGENIGIMSESGCPAVADPGSKMVLKAHKMNITVKPIVGPSSILLSLMASGLSGQSFVFHGYLPAKTEQRQEMIKKIEKDSIKKDQTQIFIETPYRNNAMLVDLLLFCAENTLLSVSSDLMSNSESIYTGTISDWKKNKKTLDKVPCVYLIHGSK